MLELYIPKLFIQCTYKVYFKIFGVFSPAYKYVEIYAFTYVMLNVVVCHSVFTH